MSFGAKRRAVFKKKFTTIRTEKILKLSTHLEQEGLNFQKSLEITDTCSCSIIMLRYSELHMPLSWLISDLQWSSMRTVSLQFHWVSSLEGYGEGR